MNDSVVGSGETHFRAKKIAFERGSAGYPLEWVQARSKEE